MISTENFNPITDPKLLCTCGHPDCDQRSVSQTHLWMVQDVRYHLNIPMVIRSGGRCPNHTEELGRTTPADHQKGTGTDVRATGATRGNLVAAGISAGFNAIGVANTFVHLGYRAELPDDHTTMWVYPS